MRQREQNSIRPRDIRFSPRQCVAWYDARIRGWAVRLYHRAPHADTRVWKLAQHSAQPVYAVSGRNASNVSSSYLPAVSIPHVVPLAPPAIHAMPCRALHHTHPTGPISLAHAPYCNARCHQDFIHGNATCARRASGLPSSSRSCHTVSMDELKELKQMFIKMQSNRCESPTPSVRIAAKTMLSQHCSESLQRRRQMLAAHAPR